MNTKKAFLKPFFEQSHLRFEKTPTPECQPIQITKLFQNKNQIQKSVIFPVKKRDKKTIEKKLFIDLTID